MVIANCNKETYILSIFSRLSSLSFGSWISLEGDSYTIITKIMWAWSCDHHGDHVSLVMWPPWRSCELGHVITMEIMWAGSCDHRGNHVSWVMWPPWKSCDLHHVTTMEIMWAGSCDHHGSHVISIMWPPWRSCDHHGGCATCHKVRKLNCYYVCNCTYIHSIHARISRVTLRSRISFRATRSSISRWTLKKEGGKVESHVRSCDHSWWCHHNSDMDYRRESRKSCEVMWSLMMMSS